MERSGWHPNLSPALNRMVEKGHDSAVTINFEDVPPGQVVEIVFGEELHSSTLRLRVEKSAGKAIEPIEFARATIVQADIYPELRERMKGTPGLLPLEQAECLLIGACTLNPGAPMGFTMLHLHRVTRGRHLLLQIRPGKPLEGSFLLHEVVASWSVSPS